MGMGGRIYSREEFNLRELISRFIDRNSDGNSGAIIIFIGKVKAGGRGGQVDRLCLEAYEEAANMELEEICREVRDKYGLNDVEIGHAVGEFRVGEDIVYVAIAARSRDKIYDALRDAIKGYKSRPPIFKREVYVDGSYKWI